METKPWYQSKLVWLGTLQTLIGIAELVANWLQQEDFSPASAMLLVAGILTVILRVWFTDTPIQR